MQFSETISSQDDEEGHKFMNLTPFLKNLFALVSDSKSDHIVRWSLRNNTFVILDREKFSDVILPQYFKHANFPLFIK